MKFIEMQDNRTVTLATLGKGMPEQVHVFDQDTIDAINAAMAAGRPLLVRGEPGIGKSQLARAAAKALGRVYIQHVVDSHTESRDLLWHFDAVSRLAEAQLCGALHEDLQEARGRLAIANYVYPGPLWWAFDWEDAAEQAKRLNHEPPIQLDGGDPGQGCVVLVDEIDKAESDVPNGLLEALGDGQFTSLGRRDPVTAGSPPPLVVITTNEERSLPDAFVRRCLVLYLRLPEGRDDLVGLLVSRGAAHFPKAKEDVLRQAADLLAEDREQARKDRTPLPGQAEYLDLVRAVVHTAPDSSRRQAETLKTIARYALKKHAGGSP